MLLISIKVLVQLECMSGSVTWSGIGGAFPRGTWERKEYFTERLFLCDGECQTRSKRADSRNHWNKGNDDQAV